MAELTAADSDRFAASRWLWRSVAKTTGIGLLIGMLILGASYLFKAGVPVLPSLAVPTAIGALSQLVRATFHEMLPIEAPVDRTPTTGSTGLAQLKQLERRLQNASTDGAKFDWRLRPMLVQLATDRLRYKHGINFRREPERARAMVGEHLWWIMNAVPSGPSSAPTREQLVALVATIEAL